MSDFYKNLSSVYGKVFPLMPDKVRFLKERRHDHARVLDLACGIGTDCKALRDDVNEIIGVDLSEEMIQIANHEKCLQMDMKEALVKLPGNFDLIYCVGNSLVHLDDMDEIGTLFAKVFQKLFIGGRFVFQIINYDRISAQGINSLPMIDFEGGRFVRNYEWVMNQNRILFSSQLELNGERFESSILLLPVRKKEIERLLFEAGFSDIEYYGSFNGDKYREDSFHLIVVAKCSSQD